MIAMGGRSTGESVERINGDDKAKQNTNVPKGLL